MTEVTDRAGGGSNTWELPSRALPAVETRELPEPKKLTAYIGASVIITATAMGSGESIPPPPLSLFPQGTSRACITPSGGVWLPPPRSLRLRRHP